jgi:NAD(P)-dependent dehydrogenase (short-subunit alcohol dehydrogenase family)
VRVLVTGGARGLGFGICKAFAEHGDDVIATCRRSTPELAALGVQIVEGIELASDKAVATLPDAIGERPLDAIVCNAALNNDSSRLDNICVDALMHSFDVNTLGVIRVVLSLMPRLRPGAKIMLVSSGGIAPLNILINSSAGNYGYRMSKSALVSFGHGLARDVRDRGIAVLIVSPGPTDTDMLREVYAQGRTTEARLQAALDPVVVGHLLRDRLEALTLERSPAWERNPMGEPAVPAEILAQLSP